MSRDFLSLEPNLRIFDSIYSPARPRYIDGYKQLKAAIKPWGGGA